MRSASGNKLCCGRRLGAADPALQANKMSGRARAGWTKRLSRGAKKRTSAPARCQPRTVSSSLFFTPSWVTPRIDLSALGLSACRISIILEQLIALAFGFRGLAWAYDRQQKITGNFAAAGPRGSQCRDLRGLIGFFDKGTPFTSQSENPFGR